MHVVPHPLLPLGKPVTQILDLLIIAELHFHFGVFFFYTIALFVVLLGGAELVNVSVKNAAVLNYIGDYAVQPVPGVKEYLLILGVVGSQPVEPKGVALVKAHGGGPRHRLVEVPKRSEEELAVPLFVEVGACGGERIVISQEVVYPPV